MPGQVAGYNCPMCGCGGPPMYLDEMILSLEGKTPVAMRLRCGLCGYEWLEMLPTTE